ncbi:hypothetical protein AX774_g7954 [Zancudomyces culisetae]|uniref:Uncharacterized protein n=1 Tax=Zancudomyces culisetae TaxID=1213189 RepID=A0A1R1PCF0_ZANCU|nr:hypothetical protein AX774_g7954 [Zancudomyces culisetae]|eukprot:OMH78648.1 hypothetical protein AX774_g7954 [Zancudomyces culisetae]
MSMGNLARQSGSGEYVTGTRLGMADQVQSQRQLETDLDNTLKLIYGFLLVSKITAAGGAGGGNYPQSLGGTGAMTNPTIPSMGVRGGSASIDSSLSPSATPTTFSTVLAWQRAKDGRTRQ